VVQAEEASSFGELSVCELATLAHKGDEQVVADGPDAFQTQTAQTQQYIWKTDTVVRV
jgi:hypothetical protein